MEALEENRESVSGEESLDTSEVPVVMPVGGRGTRCRDLTRGLIPKHLIELAEGIAILDIVYQCLRKRGFRRFIFCVGEHGDQIIERFSSSATDLDPDKPCCSFSVERTPLGGDGAIFQAINTFEVSNPTLALPGDMFLPWDSLENMLRFHLDREADITLALTSVVTEWTTDVGKIWINKRTQRFEKCFSREEETPLSPDHAVPLTSAGAFVIDPARYKEIYQAFVASGDLPSGDRVDLRDNLLPWLSQESEFAIYGYDLKGEILDLGTPERIVYARQNWQAYL